MAVGLVSLLMTGVAQGVEFTENGGRFDEAIGGGLGEVEANSIAGDIYANVMGASINAQREFRGALPSIYSYTRTARDQDRADAAASKWALWGTPFWTKEIQKADSGYLGYEQTVSGFAIGISRMIGESGMVGLAVGYDERKMTERDEYNMENEADTFHAALFGGTNIGNFFIDGYAGYSRSKNHSEHDLYKTGFAFEQTNKADYSDTIWSAGAKVGYVWVLPNDMRITPSIGLDFSRISIDSFDERTVGASGTTVSGLGGSYSGLAMPLMLTMNKMFASDNSTWALEVRGGYVPQFGDQRAEIGMMENNNFEHYTVKSGKLDESYGTVGGGLKVKLRDKHTIGIEYDYLFSDEYANHSLKATYSVSF
jgi:outer membrane autotransporter protein